MKPVGPLLTEEEQKKLARRLVLFRVVLISGAWVLAAAIAWLIVRWLQ